MFSFPNAKLLTKSGLPYQFLGEMSTLISFLTKSCKISPSWKRSFLQEREKQGPLFQRECHSKSQEPYRIYFCRTPGAWLSCRVARGSTFWRIQGPDGWGRPWSGSNSWRFQLGEFFDQRRGLGIFWHIKSCACDTEQRAKNKLLGLLRVGEGVDLQPPGFTVRRNSQQCGTFNILRS